MLPLSKYSNQFFQKSLIAFEEEKTGLYLCSEFDDLYPKQYDSEQLCKVVKMIIEIDYNVNYEIKDFAETLAHEIGHAYYAFTNPAMAKLWNLMSVNGGHDKHNPSKKSVDNELILFNSNYSKCKSKN